MVSYRRSIIRVAQGRKGHPSAVVLDGRTLQSSCESEPRAGLCAAVQQATGHTVELAWADQAYIGEKTREAAQEHGITLQIVKLPVAKKGFVLLPKRWVVERSFGWLARFAQCRTAAGFCR